MPRGNDVEGNAQWNEQTLNAHGILGNAEDMIRAHRASIDRGLIKAMLIREDEEASAEANADLDATAEKLDLLPGETLIAAAVHGNAVIGVLEHESGMVRKVIGGWNDKYVPPKLSPAELAEAEDAKVHVAVATEIARLREEHESQMASFRADAEVQLAEALAEIRAQANAGTPASEVEKTDGDGADSSKEAKEVNATKGAIAFAAEHKVDLNDVTGTGEDGRIGQPDVSKYLADKAEAEKPGDA